MITVSLDDREIDAAFKRLSGRDLAVAASWALNDTATDVLDHVQARMDEVFDRPTRFAKNAFTVRGARPNRLEASVEERPSVGKRHFLKVQEKGGARGNTGLEMLLQSRLAYDGQITAISPAGGAKLDAFGNWSRGERNQALSAVQSQRDASANPTAASKKRNRKRAGFFVPKPASKLTAGIWKREADGSISKVVHFTSSMPRYEQRLGFFDGAAEVHAKRLPEHMKRTFAKMMAKRSGV